MTGWLLDTNILSEIRRPRPEARVVDFGSRQPLESLYVSVVTLAEIRFGIERLQQSPRRSELNDWLTQRVRPMFEHRTLPVSEDVMLRWRVLVEEGRRTRHTYSQPDLIIAAAALDRGLTVVTRDRRDFDRAGCAVLDPWNEAVN